MISHNFEHARKHHKLMFIWGGIVFITIIALCLSILLLIFPLSFEQANANTSNEVTLGILGNNDDWDNDVFLQYDAEKDLYYANILFQNCTYGWKIRKDANWDVNWGGTITYNANGEGQLFGERGGDNCAVPEAQPNATILVKYFDDDNVYIGVNMTPSLYMTFSITGSQWEWDPAGGLDMEYDGNTGMYHVQATFNESWKYTDPTEYRAWKIVRNHDWFSGGSWGGEGKIPYENGVAEIQGIWDGPNFHMPYSTATYHIYMKYTDDSNVFVRVTGPSLCKFSIHSDDNASHFMHILDDIELDTVSDFEFFPASDCAKLYIDNNYIVDGITTSALVAENVNGDVTHKSLFKIDLGDGYQYVDPSRVSFNVDASGLVNEVIISTGKSPEPEPTPDPEPTEEIDAIPQTGDSNAFMILAVCALISSATIMARRKNNNIR